MNGITYRRLTKKDVSAVEKLERECFSDPWSEAMLTGAFGSEFFIGFGAFDGETPVGYALATAVKESYRRRGIGGELLKLAESEAEKRGAIRAFLEVRVGNAAAIALYESRGYRKLRVRRKYYPDGEDAFVMSKRLFPPEEAKRAEANGEAL